MRTPLPAAAALLAALAPAVLAPLLAAADADPREHLEAGRRVFLQRWTVAPSAFGQWGRGPLSNGEACTDCHADNGRGRLPLTPAEPLRAALVRLSVGPLDAPRPHPSYGDQLQHQGVLGKVPGEGEAHVDWIEHGVTLADASVVRLREPRLRFAGLSLGALDGGTHTSLRIAPPLAGLGLLEAVPAAAIEAIARAQPAQGVFGRVHRVAGTIGRFGHKATQPDLRHQAAAALHADLGVTSARFPLENCTAVQSECLAFPSAGTPEISDEQLDLLVNYLRALEPPAPRAAQATKPDLGETLFARLGCSACHVPALPVGDTVPGTARIRAYSDLLLHDLGAGLADGSREGQAGPEDWRTAPLWGLGRSRTVDGNAFLLHDGRARSVEEAILWHGGEARAAREAFRVLPADARAALLAFLASL